MKKLLRTCAFILAISKPFSILADCLVCPQTASCESSTCDCRATSQTFFSIRPVFTINSPEYLAHNRDFYKSVANGWGGTLQFTVLGGRSTHSEAIAKFFLPFCTDTLKVSEKQLSNTNVLANYLNIYTKNGTFESTVQFKPRHSFVGLGINYQQRIYTRCTGNSFWLSISGPILHVNNHIKLIEAIQNDGGGPLNRPEVVPVVPSCPGTCPNPCNDTDCNLDPTQALQPVGTVVEAFKQPGWCFGRIDNDCRKNCHKITKVGDVTIRVGYETVNRDDVHLDSFFGFIIPGGNRPKGVNVFEPIVGHNHHWGFVLGSTFGLEIWHNTCGDITWSGEFDFSITDFFSRKERRSFDLKKKPWSRYMQFYVNQAQAELAASMIVSDPTFALTLGTPGIDLLTQDVHVRPGFYRMFNAALIIDTTCYEFEVGYNFFARQAECLRLACPFPTGIALKSIAVGGGQTAPFQEIDNDFADNCVGTPVANYANNIITEADLDLDSAAHPATLTHTVYGSVAFQWNSYCNMPMFFAVGGSYEFSPDNVGLNRWMAWGKFGFAF
jgi:hypothetical protein